MCGFVGGVNARFEAASLARLAHRGPDQTSFVVEEAGPITLTFGEVRLAVVDRREVQLPQRRTRGDRRATLLYNGEVYNWRELREELVTLGFAFETETDGEVVLAAYLAWGPACLARFNGMFALAIWDGERFFCARDRLGKKPLFYRAGEGRFEIASEAKAFGELTVVPDELFDLFEFTADDRTIFRGVSSVPPGHWLSYDPAKGTLDRRVWWELPLVVGARVSDPEEAVTRFLALLEDSVRLRMRADVPVTAFLSGGLDSTLVATLSGVREAFTCVFAEFEGTLEEELYARDFADRAGITLHVVRPTREQFFEDLPALAWHLEQPTGSFTPFPLYRLARAAREARFVVTLTGEGADELFCGYVRTELLVGGAGRADDPRAASYGAVLDRFEGSPLDRFTRMASRSGLAGAAQLKVALASRWSEQRSFLDNVAAIETGLFLQPLLQMADRMTMAWGLEARSPFLDHRIVELAFSLDDGLRVRGGVGDPPHGSCGKWLVREAARRVLPKGCLALERPVKHGLPAPINEWLTGRPSFDRRAWNAALFTECERVFYAGAPVRMARSQ